jgi:hypothetical protein
LQRNADYDRGVGEQGIDRRTGFAALQHAHPGTDTVGRDRLTVTSAISFPTLVSLVGVWPG